FDLARRFRRLAGKEIVLQVSRNGATEAVHVPPAFHTAYGLRLGMGPVTAVRDGSAAAKKGIQVRSGQEAGDTIIQVEVADGEGRVRRFVSEPSPNPPAGVTEEVLDPFRLPFQLNDWAARR